MVCVVPHVRMLGSVQTTKPNIDSVGAHSLPAHTCAPMRPGGHAVAPTWPIKEFPEMWSPREQKQRLEWMVVQWVLSSELICS